jgi:hypothetical protein
MAKKKHFLSNTQNIIITGAEVAGGKTARPE